MVQMFSASNINKITNDVKDGVPERQDGDGQRRLRRRRVRDPRPDLLGAAADCRRASAIRRPASRARRSAAAAPGTATPTGPATRSSTRSTTRSRTRSPGMSNVKVLEMVGALYGRRLCENTVGLLEEKGVSTWQSAGAVDKTEWVHQIRTLTTIFPPYQLQEDGHPNYWGQLALRNCFRQAYDGGAAHGGYCARGTGLNAKGEPNMTLDSRRSRARAAAAPRRGSRRRGPPGSRDAGAAARCARLRSGAWAPDRRRRAARRRARSSRRRTRTGPAALRRRDVRLDRAAARPGASRTAARSTSRSALPGARRDRSADRRRRGRAGLPVDRHPRRVPRDLRAAAEHARAAAGRQPRHRRLGADRLPQRAVVRRAHVRERVRAPGRALRARDRAALRRAARRACSPPPTRSTTSPRSCARWRSRRSTSTATPTARSSCRTSSPATRTGCAR